MAQNIINKLGGTGENNEFQVTDSTGDVKFVVQGDGKVGIGTTSPTEKLEVSGTIKSNALSGSWDNSSNNYIRIGNFQICWGSSSCNWDGDQIDFPASFVVPPNVVATFTEYSSATLSVINTITNGATVKSTSSEIRTFNWQAMGRWQ